MDIRFLGTGGAFDVNHINSSAIISLHGQRLLIDCGFSVFPALVNKNLIADIDGVILTHLHDDHVGSLSGLGIYRFHVLGLPPLPVYYQDEAFRDQIMGFLAYSQGDPNRRFAFRPFSALPGAGYIDTVGRHVKDMQTYSFYFQEGNQSILYSGDLGDCEYLFEQIRPLDLPNLTVFHEVSFYGEGYGHTYYKTLEQYLDDYPIFGYHCDHQQPPADLKLPLVALQPELLY